MAFTLSFDVSSPAGLADLNVFLASRSYVVGFAATAVDAQLYDALGKAPDAGKFPNVARFFNHIASFSAEQRSKLPAAFGGKAAAAAKPAAAAAPKAAAAKAAAPAPAPKAEEADATADMFGDDDDALAAAAAATKAAPAPAPAAEKKSKPKPVEKTSIIYEVKPAEAPADMALLDATIRAISLPGLLWGKESKTVAIGYGIEKLVIQCIVEEDLNVTELEDLMTANAEIVGSIEQLSMSKVS